MTILDVRRLLFLGVVLAGGVALADWWMIRLCESCGVSRGVDMDRHCSSSTRDANAQLGNSPTG